MRKSFVKGAGALLNLFSWGLFLLVRGKEVVLSDTAAAVPVKPRGPGSSMREIGIHPLPVGLLLWEAAWSKEPSPEEDFKALGFTARFAFDLFGNQDTSSALAPSELYFPVPEALQVYRSVQEPRHTKLPRVIQAHGNVSKEISGPYHLGTIWSILLSTLPWILLQTLSMVQISLCFLHLLKCFYIHLICHTYQCHHPLFLQIWGYIYIYIYRYSIWRRKSHQVSMFWAASFFRTSQWLGIKQKSLADLLCYQGILVELHLWIRKKGSWFSPQSEFPGAFWKSLLSKGLLRMQMLVLEAG